VIYLHMVGGPSQIDLFDYKPQMQEWFDKDLPDSVRMGQRLTTMTSARRAFHRSLEVQVRAARAERHVGLRAAPYKAKMVDDLCFVRSMHTEAINHEPAISFIQTGNMVTGGLAWGVGLLRPGVAQHQPADLRGDGGQATNTEQVQAISGRLWSSGIFPGARRRRLPFRARPDPLHQQSARGPARDPAQDAGRHQGPQRHEARAAGRSGDRDPQRAVRARVPHAVERAGADEPGERARVDLQALRRGGPEEARQLRPLRADGPAARRGAGVRFVQIYHNNWDTHANVAGRLPDQCRDVDQPCWGLVQDLKSRGCWTRRW